MSQDRNIFVGVDAHKKVINVAMPAAGGEATGGMADGQRAGGDSAAGEEARARGAE